MNIGKETNKVEFLYLMNVESEREMDELVRKYRKDGYELVKQNELDMGYGAQYNARMMKVLELL